MLQIKCQGLTATENKKRARRDPMLATTGAGGAATWKWDQSTRGAEPRHQRTELTSAGSAKNRGPAREVRPTLA